MYVSMREAYKRLPKTTIPTVKTTIDREDILKLMYLMITISPNAYFKGDQLDEDKLVTICSVRLQCDDSELLTASAKEFAEAVSKAEAKEKDSNVSFKTALAQELF